MSQSRIADGGVRAVRPPAGPPAQLSLLQPSVASRFVAPGYGPDGLRVCVWCGGPIAAAARRDTVTCSKPCRQARHRFGKGLRVLSRTTSPLRLAYADPPYPGLARLYRGHRDYAGEVDHRGLLERLARDYEGWGLSTNARSLPRVLADCVELELDVRVAAWFRGGRRTRSRWPLTSWEAVVFAGGRRDVQPVPGFDSLVKFSRPRRTDPEHVIGAKPADFAWWLFELLGARPGDSFDDLFPGSGGIGRAWSMLEAAGR